MPITIQPTTLRYKNGNIFQSVDCLKGDKGDPGDPSSLIDDEAGIGDTDKVVSADKHETDKASLLNAVNVLTPAATSSDVGKFLKAKTVSGGKVTEYEFGSGGGGTDDYSDLSNKPQINGVTLVGNKSASDLGLLAGQDVTEAVDDYLEENFSNPSNPPLDRTLSSTLSAAPADMVGDLKSAINDIVTDKNTQSLWVQKKISLLGALQDDDYWISTEDYLTDDIGSAEVVEENYAMRLFGYKEDGTCLYCWNGMSFAYSYTNIQSFNVEDIKTAVPAVRYFRVGIVKANGAIKVTTADYTAVSMATPVFYTRDETDAKLQSVRAANKTFYVAQAGSDSNDGSVNQPFATVNHAIEIGATNVCVKGGIYDQRIDMSKCVSNALNIFAYDPLERAIFRMPNSLIADGETAVSGYTRVYSATCQRSVPSQISRVFQDGVPDATTEITKNERHPFQRGYFYRCEDTKIYRTTETTLQEALAEIEESTQYKYFVIGDIIYFSRPEALSADHPLRTSNYFDNELFYNLYDPYAKKHNPVKLTASGIETKYLSFNVSGTVNAVVSDCKSANAYLNGFKYNYALNAKFVRCEACNAFTETLGDGFSSAGDPDNEFAKGSTVTLIDCWAHDNTDDGFSDHKGCETTIYGGLFEYNGKAGITPTGGDHCTCYNVLSRRNFCGFLYGGSAEKSQAGDGMNGGQLVCYNCVAEHNIYGTDQNNAGFFLSGYMNTAMLINCKSIGNKVGYYGRNLTLEESQGYDPTEGIGSMVLIDCGASDNVAITQNPESIETRNTQIVSIT